MLFDFRKQTDVVSLAGIISWLETKNPDEEYRFMDCQGGCLFSQYLQERLHLPRRHCSYFSSEDFAHWEELHRQYWPIASGLRGGWTKESPLVSTFGEALKRAREFVER